MTYSIWRRLVRSLAFILTVTLFSVATRGSLELGSSDTLYPVGAMFLVLIVAIALAVKRRTRWYGVAGIIGWLTWGALIVAWLFYGATHDLN